MLCDNCKERDSVVTLTRSNADGVVTEEHLCERCAIERGDRGRERVRRCAVGSRLFESGTERGALRAVTDLRGAGLPHILLRGRDIRHGGWVTRWVTR